VKSVINLTRNRRVEITNESGVDDGDADRF
jgi:hypothetical protein